MELVVAVVIAVSLGKIAEAPWHLPIWLGQKTDQFLIGTVAKWAKAAHPVLPTTEEMEKEDC